MSFVSAVVALCCAAIPQSPAVSTGSGESPRLAPTTFAPPILLTAAGKPLGEGILYPSPRLYDIDQDGTAEILIGDLPGRVLVAEKLPGEDAAAFGKLEPFVTGDRPLKFHNW